MQILPNSSETVTTTTEETKALLVKPPLSVIAEGIPTALKAIPQWVLWKLEDRNGKTTKTPYQAHGALAKVNDPTTWTTYAKALAAYQAGGFSGMGIVLTKETGIVGTDLDKCLNPDTGELESEAARIVSELPTYCEVSPSGRGLRLFGFGTLPQGGRRKGKVEMYEDGRYLTVTGNRFNGHDALADITSEIAAVHAHIFAAKPHAASPPVDTKPTGALDLSDEALFTKIRASRQGMAFDRLWSGDAGADHSAADLALCNLLARWTDRDTDRVDRLFRQSGLMREKWDKPHFSDGRTYGQATVAKAIADLPTDGYSGRKPTQKSNEPGQRVRGLAQHSQAAEIAFNKGFNKQLVFDPVTEHWMKYETEAGYFQARPNLVIEQEVYKQVKALGVPFESSYISGVVKCLRYEAIRELKPVLGKICFRNGVLDLKTLTLHPHSALNNFTNALPFNWNPEATEPSLFIDWLKASLGGHEDQVELVRAFINAVITGRADLQRFLEVIGPGGSGKGTLVRLISALVGKESVHATTLKQLEENRFESAKLYGKKLVIIGDAEKWHGDVSMLKAITGQDAIRFEQKHQQAGENFTYGGMVIIAANQHTESTDYSSGIQRRRISLPFEHVVPVDQRRDLEAEFEPHLPAILKWALDLPQARVTELLRTTSAHVQSLREARLEALRATNPIAAWMLDNTHFDPEAETPVGVCKRLVINEGANDGDHTTVSHVEYEHHGLWLYPNYVLWCDQNGKRPLAHNAFSNAVIDVGKHMLGKGFVSKKRRSAGAMIRGIALGGVDVCRTGVEEVSRQVIDSVEVVELCSINKNLYSESRGSTVDRSTRSPVDNEVSTKKGEVSRDGIKSAERDEVQHPQHCQGLSSTPVRHSSSQFNTSSTPSTPHALEKALAVNEKADMAKDAGKSAENGGLQHIRHYQQVSSTPVQHQLNTSSTPGSTPSAPSAPPAYKQDGVLSHPLEKALAVLIEIYARQGENLKYGGHDPKQARVKTADFVSALKKNGVPLSAIDDLKASGLVMSNGDYWQPLQVAA